MYARKSSSHRPRSSGANLRMSTTNPTLARPHVHREGHHPAYRMGQSKERSVRARGGRIALSIGLGVGQASGLLGGGLLGGGLLDGALGRLLDRLLDGTLAGRRTLGALLGEQLVAPLGGD